MAKNKESKNKIKRQLEHLPIHPLFIKDDKGKVSGIYIDLKVYESIIKEAEEYDELGNKWNKC